MILLRQPLYDLLEYATAEFRGSGVAVVLRHGRESGQCYLWTGARILDVYSVD
jgi:hypothetical protein